MEALSIYFENLDTNKLEIVQKSLSIEHRQIPGGTRHFSLYNFVGLERYT